MDNQLDEALMEYFDTLDTLAIQKDDLTKEILNRVGDGSLPPNAVSINWTMFRRRVRHHREALRR